MTARERSGDYAVFKTLGFRPWFMFTLISGESVAIAMIGGILGAALNNPGSQTVSRSDEIVPSCVRSCPFHLDPDTGSFTSRGIGRGTSASLAHEQNEHFRRTQAYWMKVMDKLPRRKVVARTNSEIEGSMTQ